jgi:hypothetical protein
LLTPADAQSLLPQSAGEKARFTAVIEMPKGYMSGICVLLCDGDLIKGSMFNDFGITFMDFTFNQRKDKVKLLSVQKMMDKWYIRKILRRDLRLLFHAMREGKGEYRDEKYKMLFRFTQLTEDELNIKDDDAS